MGSVDPLSHRPIFSAESANQKMTDDARQMYYILGLLSDFEQYKGADSGVLSSINNLQQAFAKDMYQNPPPLKDMQKQLNNLLNQDMDGLGTWDYTTDLKEPGYSLLGSMSYLINAISQQIGQNNPSSQTAGYLSSLANAMSNYQNETGPTQWSVSKVEDFLNQFSDIVENKNDSSFFTSPPPPNLFSP